MKKITLAFVALLFAFSLGACGKKTPLKTPPQPDLQITQQS